MEKKTLRQQATAALKWIGWVLLVQFILINICAALYAYKLTHFYDKVKPGSFQDGNIFTKSWKIFTGPKYAKAFVTDTPTFPVEKISLQRADGSMIEGWYAKASDSAKGTVLLFHGISANRSSLLDEASEFLRSNYNTLLLDFRAHGNSEGHTTTIAFRETEEVKLAFDFAGNKGEKNIYLYGVSMGAVAVAKAVDQYSLQPAGIIMDMPFLSLQSYLEGRARLLGFPKQPFAFLTTFWIGVERGFNGYKHKTSRYVAAIKCPVLMEWGTLDELVQANETQQIFTAIGSTEKKLVVYTNALHESFLRKDPLKWRIEVNRFLEAHRR